MGRNKIEYETMSDFNGKPTIALLEARTETQEKLRAFRFAMTGGKQKNVKEGRELRKEYARILTALSSAK